MFDSPTKDLCPKRLQTKTFSLITEFGKRPQIWSMRQFARLNIKEIASALLVTSIIKEPFDS